MPIGIQRPRRATSERINPDDCYAVVMEEPGKPAVIMRYPQDRMGDTTELVLAANLERAAKLLQTIASVTEAKSRPFLKVARVQRTTKIETVVLPGPKE